MIIEFCNAKEPKNHAHLSVAIVVASCAFFFIPTTLIVLGYLASQPTGTLVSPLPQGTLSQNIPTPTPTILVTPTPAVTTESPIIAAPSNSTSSGNLSQVAGSNIVDKTASISAGLKEVTVADSAIQLDSQVYLSPRPGDSAIYSVKSKTVGEIVISVNLASDTVRYIDYHIVSP